MATGASPEPTKKRSGAWVRQVVDYGPLLAFLIGFLITRDLQKATWVLVPTSALALIFGFVMERRIAPLPLLAGGAALFFGSLALIFHDNRLLMIKPTVVNLIFAGILFGGLLFKRTPLKLLLSDAVQMSNAGWKTLSLRYGLFFVAVAGLNEYVWRTQTEDFWVWFKFPGIAILTVVFSMTQLPFMMKHMHPPKSDEDEVAPIQPGD